MPNKVESLNNCIAPSKYVLTDAVSKSF